MAKVLTVVLLVILVAGGLVALWSVEIVPKREADKAKLAALEEKIRKLEASLAGPGDGGEIDFASAQDNLPFLAPLASRVEKLESRVSRVEKKLEPATGSGVGIVSGLGRVEDAPAPAEDAKGTAAEGKDSGATALDELAQQDREHIKGAIREVIEEERTKQKLADYEREREEYRKKIIGNIRNAAKEFNLSDYQKQAIMNIVEDAFAQLDIAAEDARFENNPKLIEETRRRLEKEMNDRAIELLDSEQLKKLEQLRAERRKKNEQK